jgi:hypothetical protein
MACLRHHRLQPRRGAGTGDDTIEVETGVRTPDTLSGGRVNKLGGDGP